MGKRRHGAVVDDLEACRRQGRLVRVERSDRVPDAPVEGVVVALGIRWAVLARLHPDVLLDGHVAVRVRDVVRVRVVPADDWREPQLDLRPPLPVPPVDPTTTGTLLSSLRPAFRVVAIATESRKKERSWVGVAEDHHDKQLRLAVIDPRTLAEDRDRVLPFGQITRIEFGTRRLEAMASALVRRRSDPDAPGVTRQPRSRLMP